MESQNKISKEMVIQAMSQVMDPDLNKDLVSLGMVKEIEIKGMDVHVSIELTTPACPLKNVIEQDTKNAIKKMIPQVENIFLNMFGKVRPDQKEPEKPLPQGVKNIICIGSGKGGVGKSTISLNIAISLAQTGAKVALLDADIYGPSIGMMLGIKPNNKATVEDDKILPEEKFGIKVMSFGFFLDEDSAVVWRGPLLNQALKQFLFEVKWGDVDYMIIDMPPGTGDVQISLSQLTRISGGIIVTTPQNVATLDAGKAAQMFREVRVPILGVIENMSYFQCPNCGHQSQIFSSRGGAKLADKLGVPLLGSIPLTEDIQTGSDNGRPVAINNEDSVYRKAFENIAGNLGKIISIRNS